MWFTDGPCWSGWGLAPPERQHDPLLVYGRSLTELVGTGALRVPARFPCWFLLDASRRRVAWRMAHAGVGCRAAGRREGVPGPSRGVSLPDHLIGDLGRRADRCFPGWVGEVSRSQPVRRGSPTARLSPAPSSYQECHVFRDNVMRRLLVKVVINSLGTHCRVCRSFPNVIVFAWH